MLMAFFFYERTCEAWHERARCANLNNCSSKNWINAQVHLFFCASASFLCAIPGVCVFLFQLYFLRLDLGAPLTTEWKLIETDLFYLSTRRTQKEVENLSVFFFDRRLWNQYSHREVWVILNYTITKCLFNHSFKIENKNLSYFLCSSIKKKCLMYFW